MKKNGLIWIICGLIVIASCTGEMDNSVYQQKEIVYTVGTDPTV